jgi:hypothetical protein
MQQHVRVTWWLIRLFFKICRNLTQLAWGGAGLGWSYLISNLSHGHWCILHTYNCIFCFFFSWHVHTHYLSLSLSLASTCHELLLSLKFTTRGVVDLVLVCSPLFSLFCILFYFLFVPLKAKNEKNENKVTIRFTSLAPRSLSIPVLWHTLSQSD